MYDTLTRSKQKGEGILEKGRRKGAREFACLEERRVVVEGACEPWRGVRMRGRPLQPLSAGVEAVTDAMLLLLSCGMWWGISEVV